MKYSVLLFLFAALIFTISSCAGSSKTIKIIIPNDYEGSVQIYEDKTHGVLPDEKSGTFTFHINESGILAVSTVEKFYVWHNLRFEYERGQVIEQRSTSEDNLLNNRLYAFSYGTVKSGKDSIRKIVYYVGTKSAAEKYFRSLHPMK